MLSIFVSQMLLQSCIFYIILNADIKISDFVFTNSFSYEIEKYCITTKFFCFPGFLYSVDTLKSVILTLAVCDRKISVPEAVTLSRLEEEFQVTC